MVTTDAMVQELERLAEENGEMVVGAPIFDSASGRGLVKLVDKSDGSTYRVPFRFDRQTGAVRII